MNLWIIKQRIKRALESSSSLFIFLLKLKNHSNTFRNRIVDKTTDIVIEGFPRSSNSFAVQAFKKSQNGAYKIATHTHSHTQIIEAVRLGKPTLVLIRKPSDCIVSLKALELESSNGDEMLMHRMKIAEFIRWYIVFYSSLMPYKGRFVTATFEEVTGDFGKVIEALNDKFSTTFAAFEHNEQTEKEIFKSSGFHLSPSTKREHYKKQLEEEYYALENTDLRNRAEEIYAKFSVK
jgi:hypothetical protein